MSSMIKKYFTQASILLDVFFLLFADITSFLTRFGLYFPEENWHAYLQLLPYIIGLRIICLYIFGLYYRTFHKSSFNTFTCITKACTWSSIFIIFFLYFSNIDKYPRLVAVLSWALTIALLCLWRALARYSIQKKMGSGFFNANLLIVGTGHLANEAAIFASRDSTTDYNIVGFVSLGADAPISVDEHRIVGSIKDLPILLTDFTVDKVIIAESIADQRAFCKIINVLHERGLTLRLTQDSYDRTMSIMIKNEGLSLDGRDPVILSESYNYYQGLKRVLDIASAIMILIVTSPLLAATAALVRLTSPGPVFFLQKRVGYYGKIFTMIKFRTMMANAEKKGFAVWAKSRDTRVTPIGHILRRFRIDELPQMINVLRNEMSLVGPRPERPIFSSKLAKTIPLYTERLMAKPGITGWAQVNSGYAASVKETEVKLVYDLYYVQNMSLWLDLLIILKTFSVIIAGRGAK